MENLKVSTLFLLISICIGIAHFSPKVIFFKHKQTLLQVDNKLMKQKKTTIQEQMKLKHGIT